MKICHWTPFNPATSLGFSSFSLDASTDTVAFGFQNIHDLPIDEFGFRINNVQGTSPTYYLHIKENISGYPGDILASTQFQPTSDYNSRIFFASFPTPYAPSGYGQFLFAQLSYSGGTINASNYISISYNISSSDHKIKYPRSMTSTNNGSSWTIALDHPVFGYGCSGLRYGFLPETNVNNTMSNSGNVVTTLLDFPPSWCHHYKVLGMEYYGLIPTGYFNMGVWRLNDNNSLSTVHKRFLDNTGNMFSTTEANNRRIILYFDELIELETSKKYVIGLEQLSNGRSLSLLANTSYKTRFINDNFTNKIYYGSPNSPTLVSGIAEFGVILYDIERGVPLTATQISNNGY